MDEAVTSKLEGTTEGTAEAHRWRNCLPSSPRQLLLPPPMPRRTMAGGEQDGIQIATLKIASIQPSPPSANASSDTANLDSTATANPEAEDWLRSHGLMEGATTANLIQRRYMALSRCKFGDSVAEDAKREFLRQLIPCENNLAAKQTDIGNVANPKYRYKLRLRNAVPIRAKPMRLRPQEEAWLDVHLDELLAKGVIGPILPHEQPRCVTPLLLVPGQQSGQPFRVCQNIVPVNKRTDEYQYQLNDTRRYRSQLGRAKWVSMIDLKAGFHNIPFEEESSYDSTFVTHRGKFRWLRMPMGLTQAPAHFQFVVEDVLKGAPGDRQLPVVVYLDDIAVYGDDQDQVLEDTLEAIRRLTAAGFMINLTKSQLAQSTAKILGHQWTSGGFWAPCTDKIEALTTANEEKLARMNRASLYGLLNFYREYVPPFAELTEPLRELLGQDAKPWTANAGEAVRTVAQRIISTPRWLNMDPSQELRLEARVQKTGLAVVLLQRHPEHRLRWSPVASWGRKLDAMELEDSRVLLELKALREGCWKLSEFTAYAANLVAKVSPELKALLKIAHKAHPELHAMLIDFQQYKPKLIVGDTAKAPEELGMESTDAANLDDPPKLEDMKTAELALRQPIHLPAKARFTAGPAIHVQFDGGAQDGHGTGGFVILDQDQKEILRVGRYYGEGRTNNEAEAFAMRDAVQCLVRLHRQSKGNGYPVRVFGDSQLMIRFATRLYKKPHRQTIYWAIEDVRRAEANLRQPVAYRHVTREANKVPDDMARRALEERTDIIFWNGKIPEDAPPNQLAEIYQQQQPQEQLDWSGLPAPLELKEIEDNTPPTIACTFGERLADTIAKLSLDDERYAAKQRLSELVYDDEADCLATAAISPITANLQITANPDMKPWSEVSALTNNAGRPIDDRPCQSCGDDQHQADMILCDRCNSCYHRQCARTCGGSQIHDGPWFCRTCKGELTWNGIPDVTQDWPLMDHLWTNWLPQDPAEADRLTALAEHYRANGEELQVRIPETAANPEQWIDVPPLVTRPRLMMDTHDSLGHCGRDKLHAALKMYYWWPGMHSDVAECVKQCRTCQKDRPVKPPIEVLRWIEKGEAPFAGWSLDAAGPFPTDEEGNRYLLVAIDPFSKWVEAVPTPSLHSWRAADFLYQRIVTHWGKPRFIRTDNGSEFQGSLHRLCQSLGIAHHRITVGNSKANGQVERTIRTLKETIRRGMTRDPRSYWSNHLPSALAMLRFTPSRMTGLTPFSLVTGRSPQLPSLPARPLPELPENPTTEQEESYYAAFTDRVQDLAQLGGRNLREMERRIRDATRHREKNQVNPTMLFYFEPGQLVTRRHRAFSKMDPRTTGPFRVRSIGGVYRQRIIIEPIEDETGTRRRRRRLTVHASQLVPFNQPYIEPEDIDVGPDSATDIHQPQPSFSPPMPPTQPQTANEDPEHRHADDPPAEDTANGPRDDSMETDTQPKGPVTRSKRQRTANVANVWELAQLI